MRWDRRVFVRIGVQPELSFWGAEAVCITPVFTTLVVMDFTVTAYWVAFVLDQVGMDCCCVISGVVCAGLAEAD